jgi:hypothetical protein
MLILYYDDKKMNEYDSEEDPEWIDEEERTEAQQDECDALLNEYEIRHLESKDLKFVLARKYVNLLFDRRTALPPFVFNNGYTKFAQMADDTRASSPSLSFLNANKVLTFHHQSGSLIRSQRGYLLGVIPLNFMTFLQKVQTLLASTDYVLIGEKQQVYAITLSEKPARASTLDDEKKTLNNLKNVYDTSKSNPLADIVECCPRFQKDSTTQVAFQIVEKEWFNVTSTKEVAARFAAAWKQVLSER